MAGKFVPVSFFGAVGSLSLLASPDTSSITGQVPEVTGGR